MEKDSHKKNKSKIIRKKKIHKGFILDESHVPYIDEE